MGAVVVWIGAELGVSLEELTISIMKRFVDKMRSETHELQQVQAIPVRRLRSYVGGLTWMMGVIPWLRAWVAPMWAALAVAAQWRGPPEKATVANRQIRHSLIWVAAFLSGQKGSIVRTIPIAPVIPEDMAQIICDASPWGVGAVLCVNGVPVERLDDVITDDDHRIMGTVGGMPDYQASFEALAILVAARTWLPLWQDRPTSLYMQSDSLAALGAAAKVGSSVPSLNTVMRELSLDLAEGMYEMQWFGHIPGTLNVWADALSRLRDPNSPKSVPEALANIPKATTAVRTSSWWRASGSPS